MIKVDRNINNAQVIYMYLEFMDLYSRLQFYYYEDIPDTFNRP
jgi:hypothetical protein